MASLEAILSTNAVKVPRPVKVLDLERSGALLVMEHVDMRSLNKYSSKLGEQLADLHLYNKRQIEKQNKEQKTVGKGPGQSEVETANRFGFHVNTCCGYIPQVNDWQDDWVSFYSQQRLEHQLGLVEQSYGDREAREFWSKLLAAPPMEALLKRELATSVLKSTGHSGGGCISEGQSFDTDTGRVFVKINHKTEARRMFDGEMASLEAILSTNAVKVPRPVKVLDLERSGALLVMEHVDMRSLNKYSSKLGEQLADLHLYNKRQIEKQNKEQQTVGKGPGQSEVETANRFGFHVNTCCGYIPQVNDWQDDWVSFYSQQRLEHQLGLVEQSYGDREAREFWSKLLAAPPAAILHLLIKCNS
ncbi:ketosamine-3-kinase [Pimephales promelas]|nr:ketosamine-3-kinase [Pimephales promelas]